MQALSTAPVDITTASPPAATSSTPTGQDGLFASRLKTAAKNQAANAQKSKTPQQEPTDPTTPAGVANDNQPRLAPFDKNTEETENPAEATALATRLSGTAAQPSLFARETATPAVANGGNGVFAPTRSNESAVALMLGALTAAGAAAPAPAVATATTAVTTAATAPTEQATTSQAAGTQPHSALEIPAPPLAPAAQNATVAPLPTAGDAAVAGLGVNPGNQPPVAGNPLVQGAELPQAQSAEPAVATTAATTTDAATTLQPNAAAQTAATQSNATQSNGPLFVQNQYGQVLTIHQMGETEEDQPLLAASPVKPGSTGAEGKNLDFNNNYIHSHLPNETPKNAADQGGDQQADKPAQNQQPDLSNNAETGAVDAQAPAEQLALHKGQAIAGQENQPLIFAHQRSSSQLGASAAATESSLYRLPTGTTVPEGTVVDQMIAHFSVNKRLETGSVNLRLYPQELGELRMEIKVEQDNVKAHIIAQNPQAQEMIDRHLPRLREALEQQGLNLQQVEVTIAANDNASGERFQENNAWRQPGRSPASNANQPVFTLDIDESADEDLAAANTLSVLA